MTLDPKALEAALSAFRTVHYDEPEPVTEPNVFDEGVEAAITAYLAALPPTAGAEPVAWLGWDDDDMPVIIRRREVFEAWNGGPLEAVYASPPVPVQPGKAGELAGYIREAQDILAEYIVPDSGISELDAVNRLLGVLDRRDVVLAVRAALASPPPEPGEREGWPDAPARGTRFAIEHDGFVGTVIGHYVTLEGKRGVDLQQDGTRVVHVYGEKWLKPLPFQGVATPEPGEREKLDAAYLLGFFGVTRP